MRVRVTLLVIVAIGCADQQVSEGSSSIPEDVTVTANRGGMRQPVDAANESGTNSLQGFTTDGIVGSTGGQSGPTGQQILSVPAVFYYDVSGTPSLIPDPAVESSDNGFLFAEVFSGLTRPPRSIVGEVEPDLASSYAIHDGGRTYKFSLREGLKFSDGTPVTSTYVKWSWERVLSPSTRSARSFEVLGAIEGALAMWDGVAIELAGFNIVDDATFTVDLVRPHADFLWLLAHPVASVLKESNAVTWASEVDWASGYFLPDFPELPVGTGPFRVTRFDLLRNDMELETNPHYWDTKPGVGGVKYVVDEAAAEQDSVRRSALYEEIETHVLDRAMVLPMFWDEGGTCHRVQDWITVFQVPKWGGSVFRNVVIDTEHPAYPDRSIGK